MFCPGLIKKLYLLPVCWGAPYGADSDWRMGAAKIIQKVHMASLWTKLVPKLLVFYPTECRFELTNLSKYFHKNALSILHFGFRSCCIIWNNKSNDGDNKQKKRHIGLKSCAHLLLLLLQVFRENKPTIWSILPQQDQLQPLRGDRRRLQTRSQQGQEAQA